MKSGNQQDMNTGAWIAYKDGKEIQKYAYPILEPGSIGFNYQFNDK